MNHARKKQRSKRQFIYFLVILIISITGAWYLVDWYEARSLLRVKFISPDGKVSSEYRLELADNERKRELGLMFRKEMGSDRGMLFTFPGEEPRTFWMKNTYIPLDMLFIDAKGAVVGVLNDVPILNTEPRTVGVPSAYVIELNAGRAKLDGVAAGWRAEFDRPVPASNG